LYACAASSSVTAVTAEATAAAAEAAAAEAAAVSVTAAATAAAEAAAAAAEATAAAAKAAAAASAATLCQRLADHIFILSRSARLLDFDAWRLCCRQSGQHVSIGNIWTSNFEIPGFRA
jgi:flagellar capping protein FliD